MKTSDTTYEGDTFEKEELKEGVFQRLEFYSCTFLNCKFNRSIFEKCRFEDCAFVDCDLSLVKPKYCSFIDVDFRDSKLVGVNWTEAASPINFNFYSCSINLFSFFGLNLTKIIMINCLAREVDFIEANLSGGNFESTDFENSRFLKTNLTRADFRRSENYSIDPNKNQIDAVDNRGINLGQKITALTQIKTCWKSQDSLFLKLFLYFPALT